MTDYCEICGEELNPDEEDGICKKCKKTQGGDDEEYEKDEEYIDPGIT